MASTFFLAPAPKWYFFDSEGKLAVGGTMETFSSEDHTLPKPVFSDSGGLFAYINPIILDGTGGTPVPIYWEDDGTDDRYFVVVKDSSGRIIFSINDYPISGGGGGGVVTNLVDIENQIINGQFHLINDSIFGGIPSGTTKILPTLSPVPEGTTRLAPGGGTIDSLRSGSYINGALVDSSGQSINTATISPEAIPGWVFIKAGGASLVDTISFPAASPGVGIPGGPSANAPRSFQYTSANSLATTELDPTYIIGDVRAFAGETIQVGFDAFSNAASPSTVFIVEQYFGTGGVPDIAIPTPTAFDFPNATWERKVFSVVVPNINGKTLGTNGDDQLRLRWRIPGNNTNTYNLTNLQVTIGSTVITDFIYKSFNETAAKTLAEFIHGHLPKTGDTKFSMSPTATTGWIVVIDNNQTLAQSGGTFNGEEVRNLYRLIYDNYDNTLAPVSSGRGANADADFDAAKTIRFPALIGRAFAPRGTAFAPVSSQGQGSIAFSSPTHTLNIAEMPTHAHSFTRTSGAPIGGTLGGSGTALIGDTTGVTGGGGAHNIMQPTTYLNLHIKL